MAEERYICCWRCNEIHHVTPSDKAPEYIWAEGEAQEIPRDDWRDFMRRHAGHKVEGLRSVSDRYPVSGQHADPMKVDYVEVTNGQDLFLVRSYRRNIEEPVNFELVQGRLIPAGVTVEIEENKIRKEMKLHFSRNPSSPMGYENIELFIKVFREVAANLNSDEIEGCGSYYTDRFVDYGRLDPSAKEALIERCRSYFSPSEIAELKRFIDAHCEDDGVMTLRLTKSYRIEEFSKLPTL